MSAWDQYYDYSRYVRSIHSDDDECMCSICSENKSVNE